VLAAAVALSTAVATASCAGSGPHVAREVFALAPYQVDGAAGFEATALLKLDPRTLRPIGGRLRLGDAVDEDFAGTRMVVSPDRKTLAFGGYNFGELLFIDLERLEPPRKLRIVHGHEAGNVEVSALAWPQRGLLVALTTVDGAWWAPHPSQLVLVDPRRGRVLRRVPLRGGVDGVSVLRDRTVILLRLPVGFGSIPSGIPVLETVNPKGRIRTVRLTGLNLNGRRRVRIAGSVFRAELMPGLATDGARRAFVVAADRPIAEVDLPSLSVRYHHVRLRGGYFATTRPTAPGSGGVHLRFSRSAAWLGAGILGISGYDELPATLGAGSIGHREATTRTYILDTHRWRLIRSLPATDCKSVRDVILCSGDAVVRGNGASEIETALVAYDRRWRIRFRKGPPPLSWQLAAGRLLVNRYGRPVFELDPTTGKRIRRVFPPEFATTFFSLGPAE
jgi:hypothetical protein